MTDVSGTARRRGARGGSPSSRPRSTPASTRSGRQIRSASESSRAKSWRYASRRRADVCPGASYSGSSAISTFGSPKT